MRELGIRRVLKKNNAMLASGNFFVDKVSSKDSEMPQDSEQEGNAIFSFEKILHHNENKIEKFVLTGGGFGHGVGMSQYGAGYMAQNGKKYDEILENIGVELPTESATIEKVCNYFIGTTV